MTPEQQAAINQATAIAGQIGSLQAILSATLDAVIKQAIETDDPNQIMRFVTALPRSVERTELRAHHITRMQDYEYRRRFIHPLNQHDLAKSRQPVEGNTKDLQSQ